MQIGNASRRPESAAFAKREGVMDAVLAEIAALPTVEAMARFEEELPWREEIPGAWLTGIKDALERRADELFYGG